MKDTEIGMIPEDWEVVRLGEVVSLFHNGIWGDNYDSQDKVYPVIRSTEITHDGKIDVSNVAYRKIPEDKINRYSLNNGDILLVSSSGSTNLIGRAALFKKSNDKVYLFSNFMLRIRPKNIYPDFLFFYLHSNFYYQFLKTLQQTSTGLRNLPKKEFINFQLPLPPLPEQKKIAEVLTTVDKAIEKVEEAIAKTEKLKKGLMQELLTKGIGHSVGAFRETPIGKLPEGWEVVRLGEVVVLRNGERPVFTDTGAIPIYGANGIMGRTKSFLLDKDFTIIIGRVGASGEIHLAQGKIWISDNAIYSEDYNRENADMFYLFYFLNFSNLKQFATKSTHPIITQSFLKNYNLPLPPLPEQQKIAEILTTVDNKLELLRKRKQKLVTIKKGLMNDLLTGKKRLKFEEA